MTRLKHKLFKPEKPVQEQAAKAYLGVSIGNPSILSNKLTSIFQWMITNYGGGKIVIGDYLYRINEYITFGKTGDDAVEKGGKR